MIKIVRDSQVYQVYSLKEITDVGIKLKGAIIETFDVEPQNNYLFLVIDADYYTAYLDLETLEVYESLDLEVECGDYDFIIHREPYIEVKLKT